MRFPRGNFARTLAIMGGVMIWLLHSNSLGEPPADAAPPAPKMGEEGFTVLLDKDHTDGWAYLGKGEMTVHDGVATTSPNKENKQGLYWYKKSSFADFTLKLDFMVDSLAANSGIFMRFPDPGTDYQVASYKGYEIDIFGEQTGDIIYHPPDAKGINLPPSKISPPVPGAWTELEITAVGQKITVKINGQVVSDITSRIWAEGYIGLQTNKGTVQFRNIRIRDWSPRPVVAQAHLPTPAAPQTTAELVKTYRNSLVFVTGADGSGSGFLAKYATGNYLFTNAHVAAGIRGAAFKTLEGTEVKIGAASCAVGHDVFLLQATTSGTPFEIMKGVDENASIGDEVVVLGNAEGAGVINTLTGKIVGVGPQLVEVDAPFQPGNSGSPIIHLKSGKVIGVATYAIIRKYDPSTKEPVKEPVIRRFGYRLDSIKSWQPVNWPVFFAQAAEMEAIEKLTGDLASFVNDLGKKDAELNSHGNPIIKNRIDAWREARSKRLSPRDASMADQSLLSFLKVTCQGDVVAARQHITYDYFQRDLADQQKERDEISGVFNEIIQNLRKER
ncbi:MAG: DUF1080 domain-containing protein [Chthoniobacter sp.]|nr:DUF1080 domain-containing protein [Chthoniobacter sp.]